MTKYILPALLIIVIVIGYIKKVNIYDSFIGGTKSGIRLALDVAPYIISILIVIELFTESGLSHILEGALSPILSLLGIPSELSSLLIIRPLSGSGSIAVLEDIISTYGVDSYVAKCASIIVGASETIFYVTMVYFSTSNVKKLGYAIPIALVSSTVGSIVACLLARLI